MCVYTYSCTHAHTHTPSHTLALALSFVLSISPSLTHTHTLNTHSYVAECEYNRMSMPTKTQVKGLQLFETEFLIVRSEASASFAICIFL